MNYKGQNTNIQCPFDIWLSAKVCLPSYKRGLAFAKLTQNIVDNQYNLSLTCDRSLFEGFIRRQSPMVSRSTMQHLLDQSMEHMSRLEAGTIITLLVPSPQGQTFWIARIRKLITSHINDLDSIVIYEIDKLERVVNFLESRADIRVCHSTPVKAIDANDFSRCADLYSYDISTGGISLVQNLQNADSLVFNIGHEYFLQVDIHEGNEMPPLLYKCVNMRQDVISGMIIVGFELIDSKASDPSIRDNFTFVTWLLD